MIDPRDGQAGSLFRYQGPQDQALSEWRGSGIRRCSTGQLSPLVILRVRRSLLDPLLVPHNFASNIATASTILR